MPLLDAPFGTIRRMGRWRGWGAGAGRGLGWEGIFAYEVNAKIVTARGRGGIQAEIIDNMIN